jgi:hypothetical protein
MLYLLADEGPETGEDSEDDLVRSYLPTDREEAASLSHLTNILSLQMFHLGKIVLYWFRKGAFCIWFRM